MTPRFITFTTGFIFTWEGTSYEDDPDDPGGATKFGIDQRSQPDTDIRNLTADGACQIYWDKYWTPLHCDELPDGVGEVVMDIGVNNGTGRSAKWLQQEVDTTPDGVIGGITVAAAVSKGFPVAHDLLVRREAFYRDIATGRMQKFLQGWLNRNNALKTLVGQLQHNVSA